MIHCGVWWGKGISMIRLSLYWGPSLRFFSFLFFSARKALKTIRIVLEYLPPASVAAHPKSHGPLCLVSFRLVSSRLVKPSLAQDDEAGGIQLADTELCGRLIIIVDCAASRVGCW